MSETFDIAVTYSAEFKSTHRWKRLCISVCICWEGQHLNIFQLELLLVLSVQPIITAFYSWGEVGGVLWDKANMQIRYNEKAANTQPNVG